MSVTVICPYIFPGEVLELRDFIGWEIDSIFEEDTAKIGSDLMYQKLWNQCNPDDVFIMHADMMPKDKDWMAQVLNFVQQYSEAGMFGCKLLYTNSETTEGEGIIQSAGGKFTEDGTPAHFGSGFDLWTKKEWNKVEPDKGQYDDVREVAWSTFGGIYIRREVLDQVGDFDSYYEWSYNRDVDYCLEARKLEWKIYQIPVAIYHFESKDNKRLKAGNPELSAKEARNLDKLKEKWNGSPYYITINRKIN